MASYQVTARLVVAHLEAGSYVHVYEGGVLPDDVDEAQLEQLLAQKMVAEVADEVVDAEIIEEDEDEDEPEDEDPAKPGGNASLEEWQAYARSQGASDADLEGVSRNELRDRYVV